MFPSRIGKRIVGAVFLAVSVIGLTGCSSYETPATYLNPQTLTSAGAQAGR